MKYPPKIKFLTTTFPKFIGDSHAPWIFSIAEMLSNNGYEVEVLTPSSHDLIENDQFNQVKISRFRYFIKGMEKVAYGANIPANLSSSNIAKFVFPFFIIGFLFAAFKSIRKTNIVHAQFGYSGLFVSLAHFITRSKVPFFVSFYGRDIAQAKKFKFLYKYVFYRANLIFVLSEDMKKELISSGCPSSKLKVHHLGINCDLFSKKEILSKKIKKELLILVVANFVRKKGIEKIIEAYSLLNFSKYDLKLKIVGRGPLEKELRNQVINLGLNNKVDFVNNYNFKNPRQYVISSMEEADIFILPGAITRDDYGGTPIVLMEASSMQLPCITTNNAGNSEVIIDGKTGIVLLNQDVHKMANAIKSLIDDPNKRYQFGLNGRKYIQINFNLENQIDELIEYYSFYYN